VWGANSYNNRASIHGGYPGHTYGNGNGFSASYDNGALNGDYTKAAWAKQGLGEDNEGRYGKSYDAVTASSVDKQAYGRVLDANDNQWAQKYGVWNNDNGKFRGYVASEEDADVAASLGYGQATLGGQKKGWDTWGRDQKLNIDESFDNIWSKNYDAESYDEWDNRRDNKWGAQAWGRDYAGNGAGSFDNGASIGGYGGPGHAYGDNLGAASSSWLASGGRYNNDAWAKQGYGQDANTRWGKSYDSVNAQ